MKNIVLLLLFTLSPFLAHAKEYTLVIDRGDVNITGKSVNKITINGGIPGPTLFFTEGDEAVIHVQNNLDEDTSIHWHGLLLPGEMDGVPGFNGFDGIKPNTTFTYRFKIRQTGTYWYHAHSMGQEQDGHYGSIVIKPKGRDVVRTDKDYVVLLSDFHEEDSDQIMANLKKSSEYYQYDRRTIGDFFSDVKKQGFGKTWDTAITWGNMRMLRTDLSDVTGYTFLTNGYTPKQNQTFLYDKGDKVRLRFINASAMSFYDVRIPGTKMTVVAVDGQNVEPVIVDEFRFGVAETYDVIVEPKNNKAYSIVAESIDRTGFALSTLAPQKGMVGTSPNKRKRTLLTMKDMGMDHGSYDMSKMGHSKHNMSGDMKSMNHHTIPENKMDMTKEGWENADTPMGHKSLDYKDLRYLGTQKDTRPPEREVLVRLGGSMERYIWTINGKKYGDSGPIHLNYGERVRLKFVNDTMMAHPMHLHGMFFQLENGQPADKLPNKHTVIVPPGGTYSILLTADEAGEWAFHCHLLYHMMAGMMQKVVVAKLDRPSSTHIKKPMKHKQMTKPAMQAPHKMEGMHHGH